MTSKTINLIIAAIVTPIGIGLIFFYGGWQLLLGIYLLMWGNNIAQKK